MSITETATPVAAHSWQPIPSCPGYFANEAGQILGRRGKIMSPTCDMGGYPMITVHCNGRQSTRKVHQVVCEAFNGPKPEWADVVAHNDGVRANCAASNLRYATHKQNHEDMILHRTKRMRENHPMAILSEADVALVRAEYSSRQPGAYVKRGTRQRLADQLGVGLHVIKDIVGGRSWIEEGAI